MQPDQTKDGGKITMNIHLEWQYQNYSSMDQSNFIFDTIYKLYGAEKALLTNRIYC